MARRGRTSIVREVKESLQAIDKIGESKRDAKKNGTSGIHSKNRWPIRCQMLKTS